MRRAPLTSQLRASSFGSAVLHTLAHFRAIAHYGEVLWWPIAHQDFWPRWSFIPPGTRAWLAATGRVQRDHQAARR